MRRQLVLDRDDPPLVLVTLIDESALRRQVGGSAVLAAQLDHLLGAAERPNVSIRVLPYTTGGHPALHGPFILMEFPIPRDPGVIYLEDRLGGRYRDDVEDINEYVAVADRLQGLALSEADSASVIKRVRKELP